ncbi:MAG: FG-GAP repeat protein [Candidatus Sulfotelmatobacter sp.]
MLGDFNGDGKLDIATANDSDYTSTCDCVAPGTVDSGLEGLLHRASLRRRVPFDKRRAGSPHPRG